MRLCLKKHFIYCVELPLQNFLHLLFALAFNQIFQFNLLLFLRKQDPDFSCFNLMFSVLCTFPFNLFLNLP